MTEKELIILLKEGDEKAFTTLYRRYWSKVYNFLAYTYLLFGD